MSDTSIMKYVMKNGHKRIATPESILRNKCQVADNPSQIKDTDDLAQHTKSGIYPHSQQTGLPSEPPRTSI